MYWWPRKIIIWKIYKGQCSSIQDFLVNWARKSSLNLKYSDPSLERISGDQVIYTLEWKCFRANIENTTKSDQSVFLKCLIGDHCLIGGCLGAGFHCNWEKTFNGSFRSFLKVLYFGAGHWSEGWCPGTGGKLSMYISVSTNVRTSAHTGPFRAQAPSKP